MHFKRVFIERTKSKQKFIIQLAPNKQKAMKGILDHYSNSNCRRNTPNNIKLTNFLFPCTKETHSTNVVDVMNAF